MVSQVVCPMAPSIPPPVDAFELPAGWIAVAGQPDAIERLGPAAAHLRVRLLDRNVVARITYDERRWFEIDPPQDAAFYLLSKRRSALLALLQEERVTP